MKFENTKQVLAGIFVLAVGMFVIFGSMVACMEWAIRSFGDPMPWGFVMWMAFLGAIVLASAIIADMSTSPAPETKQVKKTK